MAHPHERSLAAAVAATAALLLLSSCNSTDAPKIVVGKRTVSYAATYRVVRSATAGEHTTAYEVLNVRRPFRSVDLTYAHKPTAAGSEPPINGTLTDVENLYNYEGATLRRIAGRQPGLPAGDQALLEVAHDAVRKGLARIKAPRTILGRRCTELEFAEPPVGGLTPFTDDASHDDICLDRGGVILREQWTLKGRVIETRQVVSFDRPAAGAFDTSGAQDAAAGLTVPHTAPLEPGTDPPPSPSGGFRLASSVNFFFPRPDAPSQLAYASQVWAFARGGDLLIVERGSGQVQPWSPNQETKLRLGSRDAGYVVRSDGIEVHWTNADGWTRVRGTRSVVALLPYALLVSNSDSSPAALVPK